MYVTNKEIIKLIDEENFDKAISILKNSLIKKTNTSLLKKVGNYNIYVFKVLLEYAIENNMIPNSPLLSNEKNELYKVLFNDIDILEKFIKENNNPFLTKSILRRLDNNISTGDFIKLIPCIEEKKYFNYLPHTLMNKVLKYNSEHGKRINTDILDYILRDWNLQYILKMDLDEEQEKIIKNKIRLKEDKFYLMRTQQVIEIFLEEDKTKIELKDLIDIPISIEKILEIVKYKAQFITDINDNNVVNIMYLALTIENAKYIDDFINAFNLDVLNKKDIIDIVNKKVVKITPKRKYDMEVCRNLLENYGIRLEMRLNNIKTGEDFKYVLDNNLLYQKLVSFKFITKIAQFNKYIGNEYIKKIIDEYFIDTDRLKGLLGINKEIDKYILDKYEKRIIKNIIYYDKENHEASIRKQLETLRKEGLEFLDNDRIVLYKKVRKLANGKYVSNYHPKYEYVPKEINVTRCSDYVFNSNGLYFHLTKDNLKHLLFDKNKDVCIIKCIVNIKDIKTIMDNHVIVAKSCYLESIEG